MSEKWNEYYSEHELKIIQKIELQSLKAFLDLCKKLDIDCFLYGGSLLGAVKFGGFVPWDDDLDLALMRKDYEKLIDKGPELLSDSDLYELQHPRITKHTTYPYIKFRRRDTKLVEYVNHKLKINHGIYLDIYPIDNLPDDDTLYEEQKKQFDDAVHRFQLRENWSLDHPAETLKDYLIYMYLFAKHLLLCIHSREYYMKRIDEISTRYNSASSERQGNLFFPEKGKNYFDGVYPPVDIRFEGIDMKIPKGYMCNLINRYEDISKLPPEEERVGHKPYILDLGDEKLYEDFN